MFWIKWHFVWKWKFNQQLDHFMLVTHYDWKLRDFRNRINKLDGWNQA